MGQAATATVEDLTAAAQTALCQMPTVAALQGCQGPMIRVARLLPATVWRGQTAFAGRWLSSPACTLRLACAADQRQERSVRSDSDRDTRARAIRIAATAPALLHDRLRDRSNHAS